MPFDVTPLGPLGWEVPACDPGVAGHQPGPAPLFAGGWVASDAMDGISARNLELLQTGQAATVVTGQQPGRLGGPLYTLFKIATAVDLAANLTAAGRPTVPVFWSGDADDDLDEAMAPVCWDPDTGRFLDLPNGPGRKRPGRLDPMVGRLTTADTVGAEAAWLDHMAAVTGDPLGKDLADIWAAALTEGWTWSRLQRRAVARIFSGSGLVVVSGDDPALHRAAEPVYREVFERLSELVEVGRGSSSSAPISEHSWRRPLYRVQGDGRVPLEPGKFTEPMEDLRPGVVFRSPVQDWLLRPVAVVAGPGELAYLKQLQPVYRLLGIPRAPLVPRLSGWLLPEGGVDPSLLETGDGTGGEMAGQLAGLVASVGREEVERILVGEFGLDDGRALELARGRTRRWIKGLEAMFRDEARRARARRTRGYPGWVFPHGGRQERSLAAVCALALWGEPLMAMIMKAAARHREAGAAGTWQEFGLTVTDPDPTKGTP